MTRAVIFIIMIMDFSDFPRGSAGILTHTKKHPIVKIHWLKTKTSSGVCFTKVFMT